MTGQHLSAIRLWSFRARAELEAAARFDRIRSELERIEAPHAVIDLADRAARDERRHHRLCADLVNHFGGAVPEPSATPTVLPAFDSRSARERLLHEVVAMSCVTETLSTALLVDMREQARDVEVRRVLHEILVDEVQHAKLGWAHLAFEAQRDSPSFLAARLPGMLADTVDEELFTTDPSETDGSTTGLGGLDRAQRRTVFVRSMHEIVFPGLERFGVDARLGRQWLAARSSVPERLPFVDAAV